MKTTWSNTKRKTLSDFQPERIAYKPLYLAEKAKRMRRDDTIADFKAEVKRLESELKKISNPWIV